MGIRAVRSLFLAAAMLSLSTVSFAQIRASISIGPPELPVYEQPICPGDGYMWTPGYWAWDGDYYWVPGDWVMPPEAGFLWTPGYWGWGGEGFIFNQGYWGTSVGFYGGVDYGFGYFGRGYEGGRWDNGRFFYNTAVNNVNRNMIHNVYDTRVSEGRGNRVSYNGGRGGLNERATSQEEAIGRERHVAPVAAQNERAGAARTNPQQRFSANRGTPPAAAAARPAVAVHPNDLPAVERGARPNTGNPKLDQKYQQQQQALAAKQNQDRQRLQQQQNNQHQQMAQRAVSPVKTQQVEQQHRQQTQQLQQRQTQQTRQMQQKQQGSSGGRGRGGRQD